MSANLIAKLCFLVAAAALIACALLAVRQRRIVAAHELIRSHAAIVAHERSLRELRVQIATALAPDRVEQLAASLGPLRPMPPEWGVPIKGVRPANPGAATARVDPPAPGPAPER